jgi:UDP-N-acetyl-D-mannosaminuronic acid transferase (WecB/TagA/CpsF family)
MKMMDIKSTTILGVRVNALNLPLTLKQIQTWIIDCEQNYVCVTPAHSIMANFQSKWTDNA